MDTTGWYQNLKKPSWAPPAGVFGVVWSILYPLIIIVNLFVIIMVIQRAIGWRVGLPFWLNLIFNLLFIPIQFGLKNNLLAALDITIVLGTIIWAMIAIWPHSRLLGILFVPYLVWVSIATVLQFNIAWLNR